MAPFNTKQHYKLAHQIVKAAIDEVDPYGLIAAGAPADEFDAFAAEVVRHLPEMRSAADVAGALANAFTRLFEPSTPAEWRVAGQRIYARLMAADLV